MLLYKSSKFHNNIFIEGTLTLKLYTKECQLISTTDFNIILPSKEEWFFTRAVDGGAIGRSNVDSLHLFLEEVAGRERG